MSIKTPWLTHDRCGVFYVRQVVPNALRADIENQTPPAYQRLLHREAARADAEPGFGAALTNPKLSAFEHLFNSPEVTTRKAMTIDFERGFFHADNPEEGEAHRRQQQQDGILRDFLGRGDRTHLQF